MARHSCECNFLAGANIWYAPRSNPKNLTEFGNVLTAELTIEQTEITQANRQSIAFGNCNTVTITDRVQLALSIGNICPTTWAIGYNGAVTETAGAAITAEPHEAYLDSLIPLDFKPDRSGTITVTTNPAGTTYVVEDDYVIAPNGIIPVTGGAIPNATPGTDNVLISYTALTTNAVEAFLSTAAEYRIYMDGENAGVATPGAGAFSFDFKRVKPLLAPTASLISEGEFLTLDITFDILTDGTVTSASISKLISMAFAEAA